MKFLIAQVSEDTLSRKINSFENSNIKEYCFLGKSAMLSYRLSKTLGKVKKKLPYAERLSRIQYDHKSDYLDFIDGIEKEGNQEAWWSSWLSWKCPWTTSFYLRLSQLLTITELVEEYKTKGERLMILVEEQVLLESCKRHYANDAEVEVAESDERKSNLSIVKNGRRRRLMYPLTRLKRSTNFNKIFKDRVFSFKKTEDKKLILIPTFLDNRSFRSGVYKDPFIGKIIKDLDVSRESEQVLIVPIMSIVPNDSLLKFKDWLVENGFYVLFLDQVVSFLDNVKFSISNSAFNNSSEREILYKGIDIGELIHEERRSEWASFQKGFLNQVRRLGEKLNKLDREITLIYPYENQSWERILNNELRSKKNFKSFGIQNAPCPSLFTKFYFSKKLTSDLPLPDHLFTSGYISYNNLSEYYGDYTDVILSASPRPFGDYSSSDYERNPRHVMVGCSASLEESIDLIIFVVEGLKDHSDYQVRIVPHPQRKNFNYKQLLLELETPDHIKITEDGYTAELQRAGHMIFDSSTVGLEAIRHNLNPIFIGHDNVLCVNPNEFDKEVTQYVYDMEELISAIENYKGYSKEKSQSLSEQYFGNEKGVNIASYIRSKIA